MEPKKPRRLTQLRAPLLNALLAVLLCALFVQCGIFMWIYAGERRSSAEVPFDMRMLSASSADTGWNLNPSLFAPEAIAVNDGSGCRAVFCSAVVVEEMYAELSRCLYPALLTEPEAVSDEAWQEACAGQYVFVKYGAEMPYQVISAFASVYADGEEQVRRGELYVGVRELILDADAEGEFRHVLVRGESGVYRFPLVTEMTAADFAVYPVTYSESFCRASLVDCGTYSVLRTEDSLPARIIYASSGVTTLLTTNQNFLRFLNFNPDKLNYHTEADGTYVYVESHGVLRTSSDEMLYQASESGGIDISGMGGAGSADIYAYLRVATYLIDRLDAMSSQYIGGDAGLYLESVTADGESVTLRFGFRCDNIALVGSGGNDGMTLRFTEDRLTEIRYRMMIIRRSLDESRVMLQSWYRRMLGADEQADMRLVYSTENNYYALTAAWSVITTSPVEEGGDVPWDGQD